MASAACLAAVYAITSSRRQPKDIAALIGAVEVKLLLLSGRMGAPAGHSLLFAVGAGPPHDGVRKARRLGSVPRPCRRAACRFWTSLIGAVEVKLLLLSGRMGAPAGHSLLFAVGAGPPHDGVRKARRSTRLDDLAGVPPAGSGLL